MEFIKKNKYSIQLIFETIAFVFVLSYLWKLGRRPEKLGYDMNIVLQSGIAHGRSRQPVQKTNVQIDKRERLPVIQEEKEMELETPDEDADANLDTLLEEEIHQLLVDV